MSSKVSEFGGRRAWYTKYAFPINSHSPILKDDKIYPASFRDTNEDGHGDVRGIIQSLDYLTSLGGKSYSSERCSLPTTTASADVIWVSPIYKSPQLDIGYDISDYRHINPKYGTLKDVDELITQLRQRDMKLMMGLVVNHTSNQHGWFGQKDKEGKLHPPNNRCRTLDTSQSAWEWEYKDIETQNYREASVPLKARDHTWIPMQWDAFPNAGFCPEDVRPWMRVNDDYRRVNVQAPLEDRQSVLAYWKRSIEFRKSHQDVFVYSSFEILDAENKDVVALRRFLAEEKWIIITNFTGKRVEWSGLGDIEAEEWAIGNYPLETHKDGSGSTVGLRRWEAIIGTCSIPKS
ncbi:glycoside hydrolase superfamily [Xylaria sp. FL0933]|nr:glycoside hydrolase superfamily [Xylaria sp. FL0933]